MAWRRDPTWLNRIEGQFTALRNFTLGGTDNVDHKEPGSMIRGRVIWRSRRVDDRRLRAVVDRANGGLIRKRYTPVAPSMRSRSRSAWPLWRAYSSIMWT